MLGAASRRDSWDAIAKTKSLLSYGSLESLNNLANNSTTEQNTTSNGIYSNETYKNSQSYSSTVKHTQNSSTNYNLQKESSQKFSSTNDIQNARAPPPIQGILKNKNKNYYLSADNIDTVEDKFGSRDFERSTAKVNVSGKALTVLPLHKPTSFTVEPPIDENKITVTVTG